MAIVVAGLTEPNQVKRLGIVFVMTMNHLPLTRRQATLGTDLWSNQFATL